MSSFVSSGSKRPAKIQKKLGAASIGSNGSLNPTTAKSKSQWTSYTNKEGKESLLVRWPSVEFKTRLAQINTKSNASDIPDIYQQSGGQWMHQYVAERESGVLSVPVAGFDLDDTLITTKSGRKSFQRSSADDWRWNLEQVPDILRHLHAKGFLITIFTNQNQIQSAHHGKNAEMFKKVVEKVLTELALEGTVVVAATQKDGYRKGIGGDMWSWYSSQLQVKYSSQPNPVVLDSKNSFFVGDACGRPGDHSNADSAFADAAKVRFFSEIEFFGNDRIGS
eukprot:CAMPEP_0182444618 /NCGR_PEP_ID=MMETSP1172-20130603/3023_1 /TAXON_ID=708627 /ORGANISM="Timspurckia oligopyrenoides, Strain CCMP3278" /LENGTH=278 /DNA_ID=CAMNT_0024640227 /DNA_START=65 /DNA_END=901 /DNA_ORIENTATION=-